MRGPPKRWPPGRTHKWRRACARAASGVWQVGVSTLVDAHGSAGRRHVVAAVVSRRAALRRRAAQGVAERAVRVRVAWASVEA